MIEAVRGRKVPLDGRTMGPIGTWKQVDDGKGGNRAGEIRHGSREELLWAECHGREAQTISGGGRAGAPSRWTVDPQPGKRRGGKERVQREIEAASTGKIWGDIGDRVRGEGETECIIQKR